MLFVSYVSYLYLIDERMKAYTSIAYKHGIKRERTHRSDISLVER